MIETMNMNPALCVTLGDSRPASLLAQEVSHETLNHSLFLLEEDTLFSEEDMDEINVSLWDAVDEGSDFLVRQARRAFEEEEDNHNEISDLISRIEEALDIQLHSQCEEHEECEGSNTPSIHPLHPAPWDRTTVVQ
tara:strand:- start:580 stop:987 length:408 start_codon:yes stop_codon:yes gene_type:complete